jgi:hypothetical protein
MSIQPNKAIVQRYFEEAPSHPETCDAIFADRFLFHTIQNASLTPQVVESSPQSEKAAYDWLRSVWSPNWQMTIDDMLAEEDRVMVHGSCYLGSTGYWLRQAFIPPSSAVAWYPIAFSSCATRALVASSCQVQ